VANRAACGIPSWRVPTAHTQIKKDDYRMGNSKVFFKSGILASLEERRDEKVGALEPVLPASLLPTPC